ncbi:MAG: DUF5330 domain-containing protein [Pseudorhodoplanes sp.]|jgi:Family of unknown function (DUF5330)
MFFLVRVAFWLGIVLVMLPSGDYQAKNAGPSIGAADAIGAATAAVSDMGGFCQRQPEACEVGGQAAAVLGQRAQAGARLLFDVIHEKMAPSQTGSVKTLPGSQDTLTEADRDLQWRAPMPKRDPRKPA